MPLQRIKYRLTVKATCIAALACASFAADAPPAPTVPQSVCEVVRDLSANANKDLAILGRYSFRSTGRWLGEESCPTLQLEEKADAPKLPDNFALDAKELHRKLVEIQRHTTLGKFRFGTPDYDRWAVIYGRVEKGVLLIRGSGVILYLTGDE